MKAIHRIPTTQYGYIELDGEYENAEEAFEHHIALQKMYQNGSGLSQREWKQVRMKLLTTGEFDPNLFEQLNGDQRYWINQTKLVIRDLEKQQ